MPRKSATRPTSESLRVRAMTKELREAAAATAELAAKAMAQGTGELIDPSQWPATRPPKL